MDLRKYLCFYFSLWVFLNTSRKYHKWPCISKRRFILTCNTVKKAENVLWARCLWQLKELDSTVREIQKYQAEWRYSSMSGFDIQHSPGLFSTEKWSICPCNRATTAELTKRYSKPTWEGALKQKNGCSTVSGGRKCHSYSSESFSW